MSRRAVTWPLAFVLVGVTYAFLWGSAGFP
jgi:hypothetical protein